MRFFETVVVFAIAEAAVSLQRLQFAVAEAAISFSKFDHRPSDQADLLKFRSL